MAILTAVALFAALALLVGIVLAVATRIFHVAGDPTAERIEALLPQTQCGQCRYPGCRPYAEAVAKGEAEVNRCVPGGEKVMRQIAEIMGVEPQAMEIEAPLPMVAMIREEECIGCTLCIKACPIDAIVGAPKQNHAVISSHCTGCQRCLEPCPVDCIEMLIKKERLEEWRWSAPSVVEQPEERKAA